jgi:3-hydroxymyristoyl/3-hydroxydecanoyl-(acyl carrier protein) dehydratase
MGQASGLMLIDFAGENDINKYGYLVKVENCKFVRPVYPGSKLVMNCKMLEKIDDRYIKVQVIATVDDKKVATSILVFMLK